MPDYQQEIKELEQKIANTKYNKSTQFAIGLMKAKLAKLKEKEYSRTSSGKKIEGYDVRKSGDGTVILIGFPSVGKSTILNELTNAESKTATYAFTTLEVIPGIMYYEGAKIQILDVPGIISGAASGKGRGKEVLSVVRSSDLMLIIIDVNQPNHYNVLLKEIFDANIRINKEKPDLKIIKKASGGLKISSTIQLTKINIETIKAILKEMGILNADVVVRSDIDIDELIDVIEGNRKYIPSITILNKIDLSTKENVEKVRKELNADIAISAKNKTHLDELKRLIFERLNLIRIFLKEPRKEPDLKTPLIIKSGSTVKDVCNKLHKDFVLKFKFCKIWGNSSKFPGQKFMLDHVLNDKDIIEIHLK